MLMKEDSPITIGVLARLANVGVETIRFYERKAIIQQPPKFQGFRQYSNQDVRLVRLVKKLQAVGFSLDEVKEFLAFDSCCSQSRGLIKQKSLIKIQEIKQKISELQTTVEALEIFASTCGSDDNKSANCDLLDCFDNEWECCRKPFD